SAPETPVNAPVSFGAKVAQKVSTASAQLTVSDVNSTSPKDIRQYQVTLTVTHGTLDLKGSPTASSVTAAGTLTGINSVLATLAYHPEVDFTGTDILHIQVSDPGILPADTAFSVADLIIHVGPFNHPPAITLPAVPETPVN